MAMGGTHVADPRGGPSLWYSRVYLGKGLLPGQYLVDRRKMAALDDRLRMRGGGPAKRSAGA
jgi:hypothetical protein